MTGRPKVLNNFYSRESLNAAAIPITNRKVDSMRLQLLNHYPRIWMLSGALALLCLACGDDEEKAPTEPENGTPDVDAAAVQAQKLFGSLEPVLIEALGKVLVGGGTIEGEAGTIVVEGTTLTFEGFSSDGMLVLDGQLTLDIQATPLALKGELVASGVEGEEGPLNIAIDITIDTSADPPAYGGTVTVDEEVHQLAELLAAREES